MNSNILADLFRDLIANDIPKQTPKLRPIKIWEYEPVDILTFIDDPHYLNLKDSTNICVKRDLADILSGWTKFANPKYKKILLYASIGTGKSFTTSIIAAYIAYSILCLRNPHKYFQLAPGSKIAITNHSINGKNAKRVVFGEIANKIYNCEWFNTHYPPNDQIKSELQFDTTPEKLDKRIQGKIYKNVFILPGTSTFNSAVGYNVICGIIDEATLYRDADGVDHAEELYSALFRRISSRYWNKNKPGILVVAGSPMHEETFVEQLIPQFESSDDALVIRRSRWDFHHPNWTGPKFYFNHKTFEVIENEEKGLSEIVKHPTQIIAVPRPYLAEAKQDPLAFKREAAGMASASINAFMDRRIVIARANLSRENPVEEDSITLKSWVKPIKSIPHSMHIDIGVKKDACGITLSHFKDFNSEGEMRIYVDFMLRLTKYHFEEGEVQLSWIKDLLHNLIYIRGFDIGIVSLDGYQSTMLIQDLNKDGIYSELLSVDKTREAYNTLRDTIYNFKLDYYPNETFIEECGKLEEINAKKIDHPKGGSKDVSDSAAGSVYNIIRYPDVFQEIEYSRTNLQILEIR